MAMEDMSLIDRYDIASTADYIIRRGYKRVALQFPDDLLGNSVSITNALRTELETKLQKDDALLHMSRTKKSLPRLFIMADTTYGSCCIDEVAAAHVAAECVIHYGHACLSPTSSLPARFVFGHSSVAVESLSKHIVEDMLGNHQPFVILYGLEYAHALGSIKSSLEAMGVDPEHVIFAEPPCIERDAVACPKEHHSKVAEPEEHLLGGLRWTLPKSCKMKDYRIVWIGKEGPPLTNIMLTYNTSIMTRYDPEFGCKADLASVERTLKRRYYLVERAKDANIVGIVVGTLGIAGYREEIEEIRQIVRRAGKKSYTLLMGKPNPAKLANFPECDVFVYVACAQTALMDCKEFLAPLITPFEARLAFVRKYHWTGAYCIDFQSLSDNLLKESLKGGTEDDEPRFSFLKNAYVASNRDVIADGLSNLTLKELATVKEERGGLISNSHLNKLVDPKSSAEFFTRRSFQGLQLEQKQPYETYKSDTNQFEDYASVKGRSGRASNYDDEPQ